MEFGCYKHAGHLYVKCQVLPAHAWIRKNGLDDTENQGVSGS